MAADAIAFVEALGLDRVDVLGFSRSTTRSSGVWAHQGLCLRQGQL
jgi:hypothetical protein